MGDRSSYRNVEIKVASSKEEHLRLLKYAKDHGREVTSVFQLDTYYKCTPGNRLKIRKFDVDEAEIIYYERSDASEPRLSSYEKTRVIGSDNVRSLETTFEKVHERTVRVENHRSFFIVYGTRVHLDEIDALG